MASKSTSWGSLTPLPEIFVADSVVARIAQESLKQRQQRWRAAAHDAETGGILIGKRIDGNQIVVVSATGPGPRAEHYQYEFGLDADYANSELEKWRATGSDADFIGIWHKHPPQMDYPSGGDVQSAHQLFKDPDYTNTEIVNPIIVVRNGEVLIGCFYMSREDAAQRANFRYVRHQQLSDDEAQRLLKRPTPHVQSSLATSYNQTWRQRDPQRFEHERESLQGYSDNIQVNDLEDGTIVFVVALPAHTTVYLATAPEYPHTAPVVHVEQNGQEHIFDPKVLGPWHPNLYLAEIVAQIPHKIREIKRAQQHLAVTDDGSTAAVDPHPLQETNAYSRQRSVDPEGRSNRMAYNSRVSQASSLRLQPKTSVVFRWPGLLTGASMLLTLSAMFIVVYLVLSAGSGAATANKGTPQSIPGNSIETSSSVQASLPPSRSPMPNAVPAASSARGLQQVPSTTAAKPTTGVAEGVRPPAAPTLSVAPGQPVSPDMMPQSIGVPGAWPYIVRFKDISVGEQADFFGEPKFANTNIYVVGPSPQIQLYIRVDGGTLFTNAWNGRSDTAIPLHAREEPYRIQLLDQAFTPVSSEMSISVVDGRFYKLEIESNTKSSKDQP